MQSRTLKVLHPSAVKQNFVGEFDKLLLNDDKARAQAALRYCRLPRDTH